MVLVVNKFVAAIGVELYKHGQIQNADFHESVCDFDNGT